MVKKGANPNVEEEAAVYITFYVAHDSDSIFHTGF